MVIKFVKQNVELLGEKRDLQLKKIPKLFHMVHSVASTDLAIEAFKIMCIEVLQTS